MKKIKIEHIEKTEGHSNFEAALMNGKIKEAKVFSQEGARLIEGLLIGRPYEDAPIITSRICGVCPVVHNLCSIKALEAALKIKPAKAVILARKLMILGEFLTSHILHCFYFSLPDILGEADNLNLIKKFPDEAKAAIKIHEFGAKLIYEIGGRDVHPVASEVGGFKVWPKKEQLEKLMDLQAEVLEHSLMLGRFFKNFNYSKCVRKTEYISLNSKNEYSLYDGNIISTEGLKASALFFYNSLKEFQRPKDVVKEVKYKNNPYLVGALSRINNQGKYLNPWAKRLWGNTGVESNVFLNIFAQIVEIVHCVEESKKLLNELLRSKSAGQSKKPALNLKSKGLAALEAPRGLLFHFYELDKEGRIVNCNIITPTAQFLANLEGDLKIYIPGLKARGRKQAVKIKALVRAYDPCISCATQ